MKPLKFLIPDVPPSLNRTLRMNHWQKTALKNTWVQFIRSQFLPHGRATDKMDVTITLYHSRLYDRDNAYGAVKVVVDALRHWNLLVNDTDEWMNLTVFQGKCSHRERHTVIVIEGCNGSPTQTISH